MVDEEDKGGGGRSKQGKRMRITRGKNRVGEGGRRRTIRVKEKNKGKSRGEGQRRVVEEF